MPENKKTLPAGWKWVKLGGLITLNYGKGLPKEKRSEDGAYFVYGANGPLGKTNEYLVEGNCIIVGRKGSAGALTKISGKFWPSDVTYYVFGTDDIDTNFLFNILQTLNLPKLARGVKPGINRNDVYEIQIPLPPLDEQKRIVERLDTIFTEIDAAAARLTADLARTTELRESTLNEIFAEGKEKWEMKTIEEISEKIQYGYTGGKKQSGKWKYLRITDIQDRKVDWKNVPFSDISEKDSSKYLLKKGDLLFARSGATAGKTYLFEDNEESVFASYLIRVLPKLEKVSPLYLYQFFQSPDYWSQVSEKVSGAAQPNVNGKKLASIKLPLPSLDKQRQIVTHLDGLFAELDALATEQKAQLERLKELRASVLEGAMRGEG